MNETINTTAENTGFSPIPAQEMTNVVPGWQKCLSCSDFGVCCNGPSLGSLGNIDSVRSFHKSMKKARKLSIKTIADAAPTISEYTIGEYFSGAVKDYKWTTVAAIDTAIASICGNRIGAMPLDNTCPASSSEIRSQLAAAEMKIAAAELKAAQHETDSVGVNQKLTETKAKHIAQIAQMEASHEKDKEWHRNEIKFWRRFCFILSAIGLALFAGLLTTSILFVLYLRG